jgi:hypothetical protein
MLRMVAARRDGRRNNGLTGVCNYHSVHTGNIYSPLGPAATPYTAVWNTIEQSWPSMAQLAIIPLGFWLYSRYTNRKQTA